MGQDFFPRTSKGARMSLGIFYPTPLCPISMKDLVCINKYLNALILRLFVLLCIVLLNTLNTLNNNILSLLNISLI